MNTMSSCFAMLATMAVSIQNYAAEVQERQRLAFDVIGSGCDTEIDYQLLERDKMELYSSTQDVRLLHSKYHHHWIGEQTKIGVLITLLGEPCSSGRTLVIREGAGWLEGLEICAKAPSGASAKCTPVPGDTKVEGPFRGNGRPPELVDRITSLSPCSGVASSFIDITQLLEQIPGERVVEVFVRESAAWNDNFSEWRPALIKHSLFIVTSTPRDDRDRAVVLARDGSRLSKSGDIMGAASKYRQTLKLDPSQLQIRYRLCDIYVSTGRKDECIDLLEQGSKIAPEDTAILLRKYADNLRECTGGRCALYRSIQ